ncbi:MAG TPA: WD40 repeat domain-containing protein [Anaerolineales bacterium]|nr:WD40 repeat domain-containing protein [Anaerolineales bacterium]
MLFSLAVVTLTACGAFPGAVPTNTPTATGTPTATASPAPTHTPTGAPTATPLPELTATQMPAAIGQENIAALRLAFTAGAGSLGELALRPDGRTIAAAGSRGVWLFDKFSLETRFRLGEDLGAAISVAWSPDGTRLAAGWRDGTVRVWAWDGGSTAAPVQSAVLVGHAAAVRTVAWSPDGNRIASGGEDRAIRIWEANSFRNTFSFFHTSAVHSLDWHPGSELVLVGEFDGSISIVNGTDGSTAASFFAHDGWIDVARWSPDGTRILTAGLDQRLVFWEANPRTDGTIVLEGELVIPTQFAVSTAFWTADGAQVVAAGGTPYDVRFYNAAPAVDDEGIRTAERSLQGHTAPIEGLAAAPGGVLITTSQDNTLRVWDLDTGAELRRLSAEAGPSITGGHTGVAWSPTGDRLATAGSDGALRVWDAETGQLLWSAAAHVGSATGVTWSANGEWIASGGSDNFTRVWEAASGELVQELRSEGGRVNAAAFAPFGNQLASGGFFRIAQVWAAGTDQSPILLFPDVEITALGWSSSATLLAIGGSDGSVHLYNIPAVAEIGVFSGEHNTPIAAFAWEPGGGRLAAMDRRGTIAIWDSASGELLGRYGGSGGVWGGLSWSPQGVLAAGKDDGTVLFLSAATLEPLALQAGHGAGITGLAFSPDGRTLATVDADGLIGFWSQAVAAPELTALALPETGEPGAMPGFTWPPAGPITLTNTVDVEQLAVIGRGTAAVYDGAGDYLAVGGSIGAWIYERAAHAPVRYFDGGRTVGVALSPDGRYLAAREVQLVRVWDVERAVLLRAIPAGLGLQAALAWSPDGNLLAFGERSGAVTVYNLHSGAVVRFWETGSEVVELDWSPDGRLLAAATGADIWLWDIPAGEQVALLAGHAEFVRAIDFHPFEPLLLSGGDDLTLRIWELASIMVPEETDTEEEEITWPAVDSDALQLATVAEISSVSWSEDGNLFFSQHGCCAIFEWGLATRAIQSRIESNDVAGGTVGRLLRDGTVISDFGTIEAHLPAQISLQWITEGEVDLLSLALLGVDNELRVMELDSFNWNETFAQSNGELTVLNLIPGGTRLTLRAYSNLNKIIEISQPPGEEAGRGVGFWPEAMRESSENWTAAQAPDSSAIVWNDTGTWPQSLVALDFQDGMTRTVGLLESAVETDVPLSNSLAWSPDLGRIAAGLGDGRLSVFSVDTSSLVYERSLFETVNAILWSPDGGAIALAGSDGSANDGRQFIRLVNASNGVVIREFALDFGRTGLALAFSPDGSLLVTGDSNGGVQIWDVETGERLADLRGHTLAITAIAFSPDGTAIATSSRDGTVRVWGVEK